MFQYDKVKLFNAVGQIMSIGVVKEHKLDCESLPGGIYWLELTVDERSSRVRFVKH